MILGRLEKGYCLDEGFELLHKDILHIISNINNKIILREVVFERTNGFVLKIYLKNAEANEKIKVENALKSFNQEIVYMIKKKKLSIEIK